METSPALLAPPGGEQAGARSCPQGRDWDRDRLPVAAAGTAGRLGPGSSRPRSPLLRDRRRRRWAQRRHGVPQHPHPELTSAATTSSTPTRSRRQTPPRPPPFPARDPQPHPARACGPAFCAGAAAGGREEPSRVWRAGPAPRQPLRAPRGPAGWGKKPSQQHLTLRRPAGEATDSPGISVGGRRSPPGDPLLPLSSAPVPAGWVHQRWTGCLRPITLLSALLGRLRAPLLFNSLFQAIGKALKIGTRGNKVILLLNPRLNSNDDWSEGKRSELRWHLPYICLSFLDLQKYQISSRNFDSAVAGYVPPFWGLRVQSVFFYGLSEDHILDVGGLFIGLGVNKLTWNVRD